MGHGIRDREQVVTRTLIGFVLDESSSMGNVIDPTISGFNEYVETIRKDVKNASLALTQFSSFRLEVGAVTPINDVVPLTRKTYVPNGMTPLYDAIGATIEQVERLATKDDVVIIVVQTDGQENTSKTFTQKQIFDTITDKTKKGWTFVYLGADQDAWGASQYLGFTQGNTVRYASGHTQAMYTAVASASVTRSAMPADAVVSNLMADVDTDLQTKKVIPTSRKK